ncbi:hypothetical protein Agub_g9806 [Astrephomene gubernaculifera]|uniref:Uncharacterized protein n=1 Tax=Astrephomene gubernaculifera TaxID=47775 RepID=A0AAD3DWI1_9CHLO|nr:hypothetical protein Agub_g9806 [Astrephomene gubernaculifera]
MASEFKGISEKFRMSLVNHDGHTDRVVVQIGLDGLKLLNASDNRTMRSYDLSDICRWQSRGGSLILYTRTSVDVEERQTTLTADDNTVRNALDTLTCCCMQLAELLQSRQTDTARETANNLHALVVGGGKKKTPLPSADEVEYWRSPEKAGWLQSQGEHIKNWRNRWFVLKQGYLFRFYNDKVSESVKPRGVVDLSKIQDVKVLPGRANTIQLKTSTGGAVCYIAGTETEVVEWVSAIEGAMQKIHRHVAGVEDEPAPSRAAKAKPQAAASNPAEWLRQLERNFESKGSGSSGQGAGGQTRGSSSSAARNLGSTLVSVVGYDDGALASSSSGGGMGGGGGGAYRDNSPYASLNRAYSGAYAPVQGAAGIAGAQPLASDLDLNYGGGGGGGNGNGGNGALTQQYGYGQQQQQQPPARQAYGMAAPQPQQPQQQAAPVNGGGMPYGQYGQPTYGAYPQQQPPQQQPQQQAPVVSLMDQVPQQQPAYPAYYQQPGVVQQPQPQPQQPMPQAAAPVVPGGWQVHYTAEGRPYYYNGGTGVTQWEPPAGFA